MEKWVLNMQVGKSIVSTKQFVVVLFGDLIFKHTFFQETINNKKKVYIKVMDLAYVHIVYDISRLLYFAM